MVIVSAPRMSTAGIKLPRLERVVMGLMVGEIGLGHFTAPRIVVDRHAIDRHAKGRIAGKRRIAKRRLQQDWRGIIGGHRHLFVGPCDARHLLVVGIGVRADDRMGVGAGHGHAVGKARLLDGGLYRFAMIRCDIVGVVIVMGDGGRRDKHRIGQCRGQENTLHGNPHSTVRRHRTVLLCSRSGPQMNSALSLHVTSS